MIHPVEATPVGAVAELGIGTATFIPAYGLGAHGSVGPDFLLLKKAIESGIHYIDTAAAYGESEGAVGDLVGSLSQRQVRVCTKVAWEESIPRFEHAVARSMARLRMDPLDTLMLHSATDHTLRSRDVSDGFERLKALGRIKRGGASTYGPDAARLAFESTWCDAVQVEYSILNQAVVRAIAGARQAKQELVVRSVLCKGLLTDRRRALGAHQAASVTPTIDALERLGKEWGYALPVLAIRFALDTPGVDVVLVGVSTRDELETALAAAVAPPLRPEKMRVLASYDRSELDCVHPERWDVVGEGR